MVLIVAAEEAVLMVAVVSSSSSSSSSHETRPWRGHRITIAIYTIKAVADLSPEHTNTLRRLEFALPAAAHSECCVSAPFPAT